METLYGAMLFLDIVAFSEVTEQLSDQGPKGAEVLSEVLHAYFRPVLDTIRGHGGDVLFFAGDALGIVWKAASGTTADVGEAAVRGAQCALAIQTLIPTIQPPWGSPLRFRAALGVGSLEALEVGGEKGRWMQMVRGQALDRVRHADEQAGANDVVLSSDSLRYLDSAGPITEPLDHSHHKLLSLADGVEPLPLLEIELEADVGVLLRHHLAESTTLRIDAGTGELSAEFRQVSVLFMNLLGSDGGTTRVDIETLHLCVVASQEQAHRFEGVVYQLLEDDKGTCLIMVFGLPGTSHADDPTRALLAARAMNESMQSLGLSPSLGVATGLVYCGPLGGEHRRRYSVIGSTINLAARLMSMAGDRDILCDGATRKLAGRGIAFDEAGWTTPKGFREPVALFEPKTELEPEPTPTQETVVVGRAREIAIVAQAVDGMLRDGSSRLVIIRAGAGIGKSTLLQAADRLARERPVRYVLGAADSFETGTAYFAFRRVARQWFGIEDGDDAVRGHERAVEALGGAPDLVPLIPLLGRILGFDFPDTDLTDKLRGQTRAQNLRRVLLHVAGMRAAEIPIVLGLEDGHWMDEASWALLSHLLDQVPRTLIVLTTRPMPEPPAEFAALLHRSETEVIELEALGRSDTEELIRAQLGVSEVAPAALEFVSRRAEGNPMFVREIVRSLKETGGIRIRASRVELVGDQRDAVSIPATLEGVITSRIDRLDPAAQVTVKVAAVLGRSFDPRLLLSIHPAGPEADTLQADLDALANSFLLSRDDTGHGYAFNHALTHEAAYNLLSFAQRESLHRAAAETLEQHHRGTLDQIQARLGYHFRMAQMPDRAVPHLAAAGEAAVDAYASRDAIELLTTALELDEQVRGELDVDFRRTHWCRLIGQAYYNQDEQARSGDWYRRAIGLSGAMPKRQVASVLRTVVRAILTPSQIGEPPQTELESDERHRLIEGLAAARELTVVYLWQSAFLKFALNALNQARVARLVGPSEESADSIATFGFLLSPAGLRKQGEKVVLQAVEIAEAEGDIRQLVSVTTIGGMLLTQNGRPLEGLPLLERADRAATDLRSGLHRHRPKYMLADTLTWLGRYSEARPLFLESAELSRGAEPHIVGQATAMAALTLLREGRPEAAVDLLEAPDGVPNVLEGGVIMSIIMGLGILAETRLDLGDREAALEAVREAESWITSKDDGTLFFSSIFGHSAIASVRLATGEHGEPEGRGIRKRTPMDRAIARIVKLHFMASGGRAPRALLQGQLAAHRGRNGRARKLLRRATQAASAASQPYELGRSLVELSKVSTDPERRELLDRAVRIFDEHGMALESGRARTLIARG